MQKYYSVEKDEEESDAEKTSEGPTGSKFYDEEGNF
jgi:hypothetical protein